MNDQLHRFQIHLALIRKSIGWTAAILGEKLGVSRQMISGLETGKINMTMMQYRAIRQTLDEEILNHPSETRILQDLLLVLVDYPEKFSEEDKLQVKNDANLIVPSMATNRNSRIANCRTWDTRLIGASILALAPILTSSFSLSATIMAYVLLSSQIQRQNSKLKEDEEEKDKNDDKI